MIELSGLNPQSKATIKAKVKRLEENKITCEIALRYVYHDQNLVTLDVTARKVVDTVAYGCYLWFFLINKIILFSQKCPLMYLLTISLTNCNNKCNFFFSIPIINVTCTFIKKVLGIKKILKRK